MINFKCSKCGRVYNVPDDFAGKKVRCKECQTVNTIPAQNNENLPKDCADSITAYNNLLNELLRYEKQAPAVQIES